MPEEAVECRACLSKLKDEVGHGLFQAWYTPWAVRGAVIADDLSKFADIEISEEDEFSKVICSPCYKRLADACTFMITVQMNDNILRSRLKNVSTGRIRNITENITIENVTGSVENITSCITGNTETITGDIENVSWPQPILVNKNIGLPSDNTMEVEVKQEVLSENENVTQMDEDFEPTMDIKIEPEEIVAPVQSNILLNGVNDGVNSNNGFEERVPIRKLSREEIQGLQKKIRKRNRENFRAYYQRQKEKQTLKTAKADSFDEKRQEISVDLTADEDVDLTISSEPSKARSCGPRSVSKNINHKRRKEKQNPKTVKEASSNEKELERSKKTSNESPPTENVTVSQELSNPRSCSTRSINKHESVTGPTYPDDRKKVIIKIGAFSQNQYQAPCSITENQKTLTNKPNKSRSNNKTKLNKNKSETDPVVTDDQKKVVKRRKKSREEIMETRRQKQRRWREKIKNNPSLYTEFKEKDRQRHYLKKALGKLFPVDEKKPERQNEIKKRNRENIKGYKRQKEKQNLKNAKEVGINEREQEISIDLTPNIDADPLTVSPGPSNPSSCDSPSINEEKPETTPTSTDDRKKVIEKIEVSLENQYQASCSVSQTHEKKRRSNKKTKVNKTESESAPVASNDKKKMVKSESHRRKKSREEILEQQRLKQRRWREKIKNNPTLYTDFKEKDRERYYLKKVLGKILPVDEETPERQNEIRKRNRENFKAYCKRQKEKQNLKTAKEGDE